MSKALQREVSRMIGAAEAQGFRTKVKKAGTMILGHDGGSVMLHHTPSDSRGVKNAQARLRAIGVAI